MSTIGSELLKQACLLCPNEVNSVLAANTACSGLTTSTSLINVTYPGVNIETKYVLGPQSRPLVCYAGVPDDSPDGAN